MSNDLIQRLREYDNNGTAQWPAPKEAADFIGELEQQLAVSEQARMEADELVLKQNEQLAAKDALLRKAQDTFINISLCEANPTSSRQEMGAFARNTLAEVNKELK